MWESSTNGKIFSILSRNRSRDKAGDLKIDGDIRDGSDIQAMASDRRGVDAAPTQSKNKRRFPYKDFLGKYERSFERHVSQIRASVLENGGRASSYGSELKSRQR